MTTELVWSTVKPTFEEVVGKIIKIVWIRRDGYSDSVKISIDNLPDYTLYFDDHFICYADLTAPVSPLPLWAKTANVIKTQQGYYVKCRTDDDYNKSWILETPMFPTESEAILAWNRIAEALNEVEE